MKMKPTYQELEKELLKLKNKIEIIDIAESTAGIGSWSWDLQTNKVEWSDTMCLIHGITQNKFKGNFEVASSFFHPEDIQQIQQIIDNVVSTGKVSTIQYRIITKQGKQKYVRGTMKLIFDDRKKPIKMIGALQDISIQKKNELKISKAEEKIGQNEKRFRSLLLNLDVGIVVHAPDTKIILNSRKATELLGLSDEQMKGKSALDPEWNFFDNNCEASQFKNYPVNKVKASKQPIQDMIGGVYRPVTNDIVWLMINGFPILDSHGNIVEIIICFIDITHLKETEQELTLAKDKAEESDCLKTEFINNMSHEIRTPMNCILGFSRFLNKENLSIEKRKNYINIIHNSGNQLMRIINDILEISELETNQVKVFEKEVCLNDLLLEHFSTFNIKAKENKIPFFLKKGLSDKNSVILTDDTKLSKILSNLLENALKFTNKGFIEFGYQMDNDSIEIYVKDTGIGINPDKQETIFKRFSQEEKELSKNVGGLGLGLSIAKENATLLGGKISLQSEKGKGTTFFVKIPYKPITSMPETNNSDNEIEKLTEKQYEYTILIVEDEEANFLYIETLLDHNMGINCKTLHAKHGKEAVEICKEQSDIDFVLMDLKMPIMNGFKATKLIREFRPDLPIFAQTAYTTKDDRDRAFSAGCDEFISKPIEEEILKQKMNKYLLATNK